MAELPYVPVPEDEKEQNRKMITQVALIGAGAFLFLCCLPSVLCSFVNLFLT